jgi:hypothetical protein
MTPREKSFNEKLQEIIDNVGQRQDAKAEEILRILKSARDSLYLRVSNTDWDAFAIPQLRRAVEDAIGRWESIWLAIQADELPNQWDAGIDMIDAPLARAGITIQAPTISSVQLEIMASYSPDLIKSVGADAVKKINGALQVGLTSGKSAFETMKDVDAIIGLKTDKGVSYQAERIVRTEMARVNSAGRQARIDSLLNGMTEPEGRIYKKWIHSGKYHARKNHAALDGKIVPIEERFPGGFKYPHAPGMSAGETINCGCTHVAVMDWDKLPEKYEPAEYSMRAKL